MKNKETNIAQNSARKPTGRAANPKYGRQKGTANKSTKDMREFWQHTIERNQPLIDEKLRQLSEEDAGKFLSTVLDACEFFVPKLSRTELSGPDGGALTVQVLKLCDADDPATK